MTIRIGNIFPYMKNKILCLIISIILSSTSTFGLNSKINEELHKRLVVLKVNSSEESGNREFLGKFPKIESIPHFIILDSKGKFIAH
ncbi:MAG: hypothetical protein OEV78_10360 [Spirochaetia bacterium]|nr:hypothetical protein [Spirochaetia bacterium]